MRTLLVAGVALLAWTSCRQEEKEYPVTDPRLQTRQYCNDPSAVNYNWNFPGVVDNSTCFYGADLFKGQFSYRDSIYNANGTLDSVLSGTTYQLDILRLDSNRVGLAGFCGAGETLSLTARRIGFRATLDSTGRYGQRFCRPQDTISGVLTRELADTASIRLSFTVFSDTVSKVHRGTAYRR